VEVLVALEPDPGTDPEDVERLGRQLRNELRALDVDDVAVVDGGPPPDGAKSGAAVSLTEWLVTLSAGGGVFVTVIGTLKDWLSRRGAAHKLTVTIDGDTLELSDATQAERAELIETFVRRHQPA
jgi:Effector Associated Constant Component 1